MDDQGWVKSLTSNTQLILDSLRSSTVVEVQDDKVRRRNEWMKWIPSRVSTESGLISPGGSSSNMLTSSFQQITMKESSTQSKADQSQLSNGEGLDQN
ncbi:hypothetical protein COLO4_26106 [Corchorus olitorius]|uniref:Uncharacterized protein n=1 Tax=Corchorus olitorius TaxID=93759 RepID=A0A1R3HYY1_9ROSI|nr:hypothetical protein COLO4_26106 [Corchorus olitorius]